MSPPNTLNDFHPAKFAIYRYCTDCDHRGVAPRADESMTIPALKAGLRCSACGSHDTSIRICYTGAGEYAYCKTQLNG